MISRARVIRVASGSMCGVASGRDCSRCWISNFRNSSTILKNASPCCSTNTGPRRMPSERTSRRRGSSLAGSEVSAVSSASREACGPSLQRGWSAMGYFSGRERRDDIRQNCFDDNAPQSCVMCYFNKIDTRLGDPYPHVMQVDIGPELQAKLDRLAAERGRDPQALVQEAIARFVDYDEWVLREVESGF